MLHLMMRFIRSMIPHSYREMLLVLFGMVCSLFLLMSYVQTIFGFQNNYIGVSDKEAVEYVKNIQYVQYKDSDGMEEIIRFLEEKDGIFGIEMNGMIDGEAMQCGVTLPYIEKGYFLLGTLPSRLEDGEIIISYSNRITRDDEESSIMNAGSAYFIGDQGYTIVAEVQSPEGHILSVNDFLQLYKKQGSGPIDFYYRYHDGLSKKEIRDIQRQMDGIKKPRQHRSIQNSRIDLSLFLDVSVVVIFGLLLTVLNYLFLYSYLIQKRLEAYSTLQLLGMTKQQMRFMLIIEMISLFVCAGVISVGGFMLSYYLNSGLNFRIKDTVLYSVGVLFLLTLVMSILFSYRAMRKNPCELYRLARKGE